MNTPPTPEAIQKALNWLCDSNDTEPWEIANEVLNYGIPFSAKLEVDSFRSCSEQLNSKIEMEAVIEAYKELAPKAIAGLEAKIAFFRTFHSVLSFYSEPCVKHFFHRPEVVSQEPCIRCLTPREVAEGEHGYLTLKRAELKVVR